MQFQDNFMFLIIMIRLSFFVTLWHVAPKKGAVCNALFYYISRLSGTSKGTHYSLLSGGKSNPHCKYIDCTFYSFYCNPCNWWYKSFQGPLQVQWNKTTVTLIYSSLL